MYNIIEYPICKKYLIQYIQEYIYLIENEINTFIFVLQFYNSH